MNRGRNIPASASGWSEVRTWFDNVLYHFGWKVENKWTIDLFRYGCESARTIAYLNTGCTSSLDSRLTDAKVCSMKHLKTLIEKIQKRKDSTCFTKASSAFGSINCRSAAIGSKTSLTPWSERWRFSLSRHSTRNSGITTPTYIVIRSPK